ncbi:unnamed protein product, partial [Onchocerca flexuosa]|uniref:Uncharacterized protein n=1 Tax=Onchocerca flexuosa TaxID=387005 RepID=A0A183H5B3_9BILA
IQKITKFKRSEIISCKFTSITDTSIAREEWCIESGYAEKQELLCQKTIKIEFEHYCNSDLPW